MTSLGHREAIVRFILAQSQEYQWTAGIEKCKKRDDINTGDPSG